jgi:hypothetical protein
LSGGEFPAAHLGLQKEPLPLCSGDLIPDVLAEILCFLNGALIELDSPGGLVSQDEVQTRRGDVTAVVKRGAACASACAMIIYITASRHSVEPGGKLGIHSCKSPNGTNDLCNEAMAQHALRHGTATRAIANFAGIAGPSDMIWLGADDAECWGLVKSTDNQPRDDCALQVIRRAFQAARPADFPRLRDGLP